MSRIQDFFFRWRGLVMAFGALAVLYMSKPNWTWLVCGLSLSLLGEFVRLCALGYTGQPTRSQQLNAPELVVSGPYAIVRNPLYVGNVLNALGTAVAACGDLSSSGRLVVAAVAAVTTFVVYSSCILAEERFLAQRFGEAYRHYCAQVPRLLPNWAALLRSSSQKLQRQAIRQSFCWSALRFEKASLVWLVLVWSYLVIRCSMG